MNRYKIAAVAVAALTVPFWHRLSQNTCETCSMVSFVMICICCGIIVLLLRKSQSVTVEEDYHVGA